MNKLASQGDKVLSLSLSLFWTYHRFIGVLLELHKTHSCHMLQLAALDIVQFIAIEVRHHGRRCDAQRLLTIDIPCDNVVCVQQRLTGREEGKRAKVAS